jgi:hypothetical protein
LIGFILIELFLDLRLAGGLDESAVLIGGTRVSLVLGEEVVEV